MKRYLPLLTVTAAVVITLAVSGCGGPATAGGAAPGQAQTKEVRYQGSANNVSLLEVAEDLGYLGDVKLKWVGNTISGPQDIQSVATNQTDIGGAFAGAVVKLIDAGAAVKGVVNYYGEDEKSFIGFYALDGSPIHSAKDFIGKKIAVNTLGAHADAVINGYLKKNGLSEAEIKSVQLVVLPPNDTEEAIRRGQVDIGALSGVLQDHAVATGGLRSIFSDYELYGAFAGGQLVLRNDFAAQNPDTSATLATGVAKAIQWETSTPKEEVIARFTKIITDRNRGESTANLKYWKSVGVPNAGIITDADFSRWESWLKDTGIISGAINPGKYYTNQFNQLASAPATSASKGQP
ncbi:ABC transporter substrate-binding protein [Arthrobacter sp. 35W]|uniref:ABC transporter substrate-binding protein n=1 Tax=Arthrobacter sp. 35W TaxID=1132441 RepID=UPI00041145B9|nr:ABC transporter substrate-binding protein [Arthrobacter sp. 35W]